MIPAVLVIDPQVDYCHPDGKLGQMGRDCTPTMAVCDGLNRFLPQVRALRIPITILESNTPTLAQKGTPGAELCIDLGPRDRIITKTHYNGFTATALGADLGSKNADAIFVAGVDTHLCVEGTVREAWDRGWKIYVISDLVGTRGENREFHDASLKVMGKYFATVITSEEAIAMLTAAKNGTNG